MRTSKAFVALLLATIFSAAFLQAPYPARAQSSTIPISQEYASGDIQIPPYYNLLAWYSWVNINGTHMIFLALHSNQQPSPVFSFAGQAYNISSGSRVFVGNALLAMEVYNDTNHNGHLDANYSSTPPITELKYTLIMNASQTFTTTNVTKTVINGIPHYRWGASYGTIQAILINATAPEYGYGGGMAIANANIDYVSMFYDYSLSGNTTFLKTSYRIGNVTLTPLYPNSPVISLQGLSLSLLHATITVASKQLTVIAGNSPYNSQNNTAASPFNAAQVNVDNTLAYEFRFKDNYTLLTNPITTLPAVYLASPINSVPPNAFQGYYYQPLVRVQDYLKGQLPDIAGLPSTSDLNYSATQFLYRVSYPVWSGHAVNHDPTYVAHVSTTSTSTQPPSQPPPNQPPQSQPPTTLHPTPLPPQLPTNVLYVAALTGLLALLVAVNGMRRPGKNAQAVDEPLGG